MSDNRTDLPSPSAPNFQQRLRETVQTYLGRQGSPLDRGLTLRDLLENGIVSLKNGFTLKPGQSGTPPLNPGSAVEGVYEPDLTPPPVPTGLVATAAISHILIEHDAQLYSQGHGHLRTRLYGATRAAGAPAPVFSDAVEIAQFSGTVYAHSSNPATTWHLWIKWETVDGVLSAAPAGGTNGVVATTGQDVSSLLAALTGELTESQLYAGLTSRIDLIDGPASLAGSVAQRVALEATNRANAISAEASTRAQAILDEAAARNSGDSALQTQINMLSAAGSGDFSELLAAVQDEQMARIAGDTAEATARQTLAAQMRGDYTGTDPSALTTGLVYNERQARISADGAISTSVSNLSATVTSNYNTLNAAITSEQTARANADTAISTQINSVSAVANAKNKTYYQASAPTSGLVTGDIWFDSDDGNKAYRYSGSAWVATDDTRIAANAAAIQTEATTRASETGSLFAKYTVKVDVNGYVSGFGLASTANNGTPTSEFTIVADKFSIAPVQTDNTANDGSPFFHRTTATMINGVSVPAGTYMKAAYIHDATITNAKIANLAVDNAKIADVAAGKLTAGSIAVGQYIQSAGYIAGLAGWRINGDGNAELSNAVVRGTVYATNGEFTGTVKAGTTILGASATSYGSGVGFYAGLDSAVYKWRVGNPVGARIQWTGSAVEVYNASNQLTLGSGGVNWFAVTGTGKPADGATNGSNLVRKPTFADGSMGSWDAAGVSAGDYNNYTSGNFIYLNKRDTLEQGNDFAVVPGEVIYVAASITTWQSAYTCGLGLAFINSSGTIFDWKLGAVNPAMTGWSRRSGSITVPTSAVKAIPWLQIDGPGSQTLPVCWATELYLGRQEEGATVGAAFGVNISGQITPSNVGTYIASAAIGTAYIADAAITSAKIGSAAVGSAQIADASITSAKIGIAAITTAKIGDAQVNTLQLAGQAVTIPTSAYTDGAIQLSGGASGTLVQSVSFTSSGAPVYLAYDFFASATGTNQGTVTLNLQIKRGSTVIRSIVVASSPSISNYISGAFSDTPGEGVVTYQILIVVSSVFSFTGSVSKRSLFTLETKR